MTLVNEDVFAAFQRQLETHGLLIATAVEGVYLRSRSFERIVRALDDLITDLGSDQEAVMYWTPSVMQRELLNTTDYIRSFPNLSGVLTSYGRGQEGYDSLLQTVDSHAEWHDHFDPTDLALCPAACHNIYPMLTDELLIGDRRFEVLGQCFRHEPSPDPARMQTFRMHEYVYVGTSAGAWHHRDLWIERALSALSGLGLDVKAVDANDPFFGRTGMMLAANQRAESLKIELAAPIYADDARTAIASGNCHLDHFGSAFRITAADGEIAHSACFGFGDERIVLALLSQHGLDPGNWPRSVRAQLEL